MEKIKVLHDKYLENYSLLSFLKKEEIELEKKHKEELLKSKEKIKSILEKDRFPIIELFAVLSSLFENKDDYSSSPLEYQNLINLLVQKINKSFKVLKFNMGSKTSLFHANLKIKENMVKDMDNISRDLIFIKDSLGQKEIKVSFGDMKTIVNLEEFEDINSSAITWLNNSQRAGFNIIENDSLMITLSFWLRQSKRKDLYLKIQEDKAEEIKHFSSLLDISDELIDLKKRLKAPSLVFSQLEEKRKYYKNVTKENKKLKSDIKKLLWKAFPLKEINFIVNDSFFLTVMTYDKFSSADQSSEDPAVVKSIEINENGKVVFCSDLEYLKENFLKVIDPEWILS